MTDTQTQQSESALPDPFEGVLRTKVGEIGPFEGVLGTDVPLWGLLPGPFEKQPITPPGLVEGPGGPRDDLVPAVLPMGAAVINAAAVEIIGAERLQLLTAAVASRTIDCRLSAGEFVLAPNVGAVLGRACIQELNDTGNDLYNGLIKPDATCVQMAREIIDDVILKVLAGPPEDLCFPTQSEPAPALAGGGMLGIAMGAGADEWNRQRVLERLDKGEKRAEEELGMRRATHGQQTELGRLQIEEAKAKQSQQESARQLLGEIQGGYKQILGGDFSPLTEGIDTLYNKQAEPFNDGMTMAYQTDKNGSLVLNQLGKDGSQVTSKTLDRQAAANLYLQGKAALFKFQSPELFQAALTAEAAAREKAAERASKEKIATGNNATTLKAAEFNQGATDRRHADTVDVQRGELGIKREKLELDKERGGLTQQQMRQNAEIDAARETITGMDAAEIRRRTAKTTDTGRENRDFDPALERAAKLASRRKIGRDDSFDNRQGTFAGKSLTQMTDDELRRYGSSSMIGTEGQSKIRGEQTRRRFAADPGMKGYTLGQDIVTGKDSSGREVSGFAVRDANGKVVGAFQ